MTRFAIIKLLNELPEEELVCLNSTLRPNNLQIIFENRKLSSQTNTFCTTFSVQKISPEHKQKPYRIS